MKVNFTSQPSIKRQAVVKVLTVCAWRKDWEETDRAILKTPSLNQSKRQMSNLSPSAEKGSSPVQN